MADVRALLKAKRQEARVTHPYATYSASGALRCTACGAAVKFASAWEGHLGSKAHRVAVANLKAKEEAAAAAASSLAAQSKRSVEDDADDEQMEVEVPKAKRQRTEEREVDGQTSTAFLADFFSDPSRALPPRDEDDDDDMGEGKVAAAAAAAPPPPKSQFDVEWAAFERDMQSLQKPALDPQEAYARATVAAEPELVPTLEGLPGQVPAEGGEGAPASELEQKISEEEERKRKVQEERELIMDRLLEEERVQEEADSRVAALKSRVEMLKKKRELAKAKGNKAGTRT